MHAGGLGGLLCNHGPEAAVKFRCQLRMSRIVTCGPQDCKRSASARGGEQITLGGRGHPAYRSSF